jgi:hypothetical protein
LASFERSVTDPQFTFLLDCLIDVRSDPGPASSSEG